MKNEKKFALSCLVFYLHTPGQSPWEVGGIVKIVNTEKVGEIVGRSSLLVLGF